MTDEANPTIPILKKAQRLARADGKRFGVLPMAERAAYLAKAKAALEQRDQAQ